MLQTVLINSPFCGTLFSDNLRFINWEGHAEGTHGGISRVVRDCAREDVVVEACGNSPDVLFAEDIVRLLDEGAQGGHGYLFARKVDVSLDPRIHELMTCWHSDNRSGTSGETTGNGAGTHMYPPPPMTHMYPPPPMTTGNGAGTSGDTEARRHSSIEMYDNDVARHEAHARHTPRHTPAYPRGHDSSPATLQALPKRCQCVRGGEQPSFRCQ